MRTAACKTLKSFRLLSDKVDNVARGIRMCKIFRRSSCVPFSGGTGGRIAIHRKALVYTDCYERTRWPALSTLDPPPTTLLDDQFRSTGRPSLRCLPIRRRTESPHTRRTPKIGGGGAMSSARNATVNGRGSGSASVTTRTTMYELSERTASRIRRAPSPLFDDGSQRRARPGGRGRPVRQRMGSGRVLLRLM